ncbi:hypothetical protein GOBAR_AA34486 [Gossypium barbadense]|uniref:RING-type E3 ubiquitin transferase n=1 Tax=Gossypium barbadense TaxID=3634 RepID=A0A2P5W562_GOSBA|nr:hypothetical protein GOBAR_AA34486 [Gossypium barbadense]
MAHDSVQLPCDGDGACMRCKVTPLAEETLTCSTCATPWHVACLASPPETLASTLQWQCPDCSGDPLPSAAGALDGTSSELFAAIRAIESDESLNCSFCMLLPDRPVTTPCGHNFCLKCFQKWIGQGKRTCAKCRSIIPPKMASQPRINSTLVSVIRMAKLSKSNVAAGPMKVYHFVQNQDRPDKAFTTERAQKPGKANAASGKIFVTVPPDHFGPITAENDPARNQGVLVGECWEDRLECRQWGAHLPHVAGIAGQSNYGAQSVALSGGYEDDEDHGEWFLYTGSGGRDLSGNKRTNKEQSFDQKFEKMNEALRDDHGDLPRPLPAIPELKKATDVFERKESPSWDFDEEDNRWRWKKPPPPSKKPVNAADLEERKRARKAIRQAHTTTVRERLLKGCSLFPSKKEFQVSGATSCAASYDASSSSNSLVPRTTVWANPVLSCFCLSHKEKRSSYAPEKGVRYDGIFRIEKCWRKVGIQGFKVCRYLFVRCDNEPAPWTFSCLICRQVMNLPVTTPCAHNFCKSCFEAAFSGKTAIRERSKGGRTLRSQKNVLHCPSCPTDISDFLQNLQVNRELMGVIESLKQKSEENQDAVEELSEEQVDESEENADIGSGDSETAQKTKNPDPKDDLQNPPPDSDQKRTSKRMKVDTTQVVADCE